MTHFRRLALFGILAVATSACADHSSPTLSDADKKTIADSLKKLVVSSYNLSAPNAVQRMMSLYPESGPIYSTASGHISTTRPQLQAQVDTFWHYVGSNMRNPRWEWTAMH